MSERDSWGFAAGDDIVPGRVVHRLLGGGRSYEAYLAFDDELYSAVVVKVLRPGLVEDPGALRGLRREVEMLGRLSHPVVVRSFGATLDGPRPHLVLEHLEGPRLSRLVRKYGPLPVEQLLPLGLELCSALHYLAGQRVVHLDVKPSNVIMGAPARLIDLSVARSLEATQALTYPIGTDAYMAPEQCEPPTTGTPGHASDMWGLGATLFHAIAGHRPFDEGRPDAAGLGERFPQLVELPYGLPDHVPADVAKLVHACLEPDPGNRPLPHELAEGLEPALARMPRGRLAGFKIR